MALEHDTAETEYSPVQLSDCGLCIIYILYIVKCKILGRCCSKNGLTVGTAVTFSHQWTEVSFSCFLVGFFGCWSFGWFGFGIFVVVGGVFC